MIARPDPVLLLIALSCLQAGCGEFAGPTSHDILTRPLGTSGPFKRGTPKEAVLEAWGQPDRVIQQGVDELGSVREEWVYTGRMPNIPIDYEYVSRTQRLFFEGNSLVRWKSEQPAADRSS